MRPASPAPQTRNFGRAQKPPHPHRLRTGVEAAKIGPIQPIDTTEVPWNLLLGLVVELRMTIGAGCPLGLPIHMVMTLGAVHLPVVLIETKAAHGIVLKPQMLTLPPFGAVAFGAPLPQRTLVGIIRLMAGNAEQSRFSDLTRLRDSGGLMAGTALGRQVFPCDVLTVGLILQNVVRARILLGHDLHRMAGDARCTVFLRMFHLVACCAGHSQAPELGRCQLAPLGPRLVALDAIHLGMFADQRELRVLRMFKLQRLPAELNRSSVALRAGPFELTIMRILVTIHTFRFEAPELS